MSDIEKQLEAIEENLGAGDYSREEEVKWLISTVRAQSTELAALRKPHLRTCDRCNEKKECICVESKIAVDCDELICADCVAKAIADKGWRCFKCGVVFVDYDKAAAHFAGDFCIDDEPYCSELDTAQKEARQFEAERDRLAAENEAMRASMEEVYPTVEFYLEREIRHPANHQEFAQKAQEKLTRFRKALSAHPGAKEKP